MINCIWQSLCLDIVNIKVCVKFYKSVPKGSTDRVSFTFFQNLNLGKASTNDKWHLTTPWARSCQYFYECEVRIGKSARESMFGSRVMLNSDHEGRIFLYAPNNHNRFFFLHTFRSPAFDFNVGVAINEIHI